MSQRVVLVDGVGKTCELELPAAGQDDSLTIPHAGGGIAFHRVAVLPDGRAVYGYPFENRRYELWRIERCWDASLSRDAVDALMRDVDLRIASLGAPPTVVLLDETRDDDRLRRRTVWGVVRYYGDGR